MRSLVYWIRQSFSEAVRLKLLAALQDVIYSLRRMRAGEVTAAGFPHRLEFHHFDARQVGIENVELPLAVAADLSFFVAVGFPSMRLHERLRLLHVGHAERNVIHHSREPQVGV